MIDVERALRVLTGQGVDFIVVGGIAGTLLGSARLTTDLDLVYSRSEENLERLVEVLGAYHPYLRGAPPDLPFRWDRETVKRGLNFTLVTDLGDLDLLGEVTGGGGYDALLGFSVPVSAHGLE